MLALMRSAGSIQDRELVRDIRRAGTDIGREADQNSPNVRSQIESLENRVRLTARPVEAAPEAQPRRSPCPNRFGRHAARPTGHRRLQSRREGVRRSGSLRAAHSTPSSPACADRARGTGAPWDPPLTPMAERITALPAATDGRARRDSAPRRRAVGSGCHGSPRRFPQRRRRDDHEPHSRARPGRSQAGWPPCLSEMREGGRFADLRQQFNVALADEKGVARLTTRPPVPSPAMARIARPSSR